MYVKWSNYTKEHPYASVLIVAVVASLFGITIEYLINQDFVLNGLWVTLILVIGQLWLIKRKKK